MSDNNKIEDSTFVMETLPEKLTKALSPKEEMSRFAIEISSLMSQLQITAMEAIIHYSQKKGIEIEVVAKLINKDLKMLLKDEAASLNFLRYKNGKVIRPRKASSKKVTRKSLGSTKRKK